MDRYKNFHDDTSIKDSGSTMKINGNDENDASGKTYRVEMDFRRTFLQKHFKCSKMIPGLSLLLLLLIAILLAWLVILSLSNSNKDVVHRHIHYIQSVDSEKSTSESPKIIVTNEKNHDFTTDKSEEREYTRGVIDDLITRESPKMVETIEKNHDFTTDKSEEREYTRGVIDDFVTRESKQETATTEASRDVANAKQDLSNTIVLRDGNKLWTYHIVARNMTLLHEADSKIVAFEIYDETIFWTDEVNSSKIKRRYINATDKMVDIFFEDARVKPRAMAVDAYTGNLYLVDESAGILAVVNVHTMKHALLAADLDAPREIALDSAEGLLFVLQNDSITRLFLDGTGRVEIERGEFRTMDIDVYAKRIYGIYVNEAFTHMSSSDYDGESRDRFSWRMTTRSFIMTNGTYRNFQERYVLTCFLRGGHCEDRNVTSYVSRLDCNIGKVDSTKFYRSFERDEHFRNNSCSVNNGGCQHLCLLTRDKGRSCACHMGWQLNDDLAGCSKVRDFLLYTIDKRVRARNLDLAENVAVDVIWPTSFQTQSLSVRDTVMFEYDARNDEFYFADEYNIYKMKLLDYQGQSVVYKVSKNQSSSTIIASFAYDWLSRNIYYVMDHSIRWSIFCFNVDLGAESQRRLTDRVRLLTPFDLVVCPSRGYLFYKTGESMDRLYVRRAFLNGTNVSWQGRINYYPRTKLIAVDHSDDRIYWISVVDSPIVTIQHAKLDGYDRKTIEVRLPYIDSYKGVKSMYVHGDWLYLGTYATVARVDKKSGKDAVKILPGPMDKDLSAVSDGDSIRVDGVQVISSGLQSRIRD